jgi:hypothetical protein
MFRTEIAYKKLIGKLFWLAFPIFCFFLLLSSLFVFQISVEIQDSLLSILSILFPLIAGFLTFGRDTLKSLKKKIDTIISDDEADIGSPVTDSDRGKIKTLKSLSDQFVDMVISTFFISFLLIIILLTAKFNNFTFLTANQFSSMKDFLMANWLGIISKIVFFYLVYIMLLNTLFLTIFIIKVTRNDDLVE